MSRIGRYYSSSFCNVSATNISSRAKPGVLNFRPHISGSHRRSICRLGRQLFARHLINMPLVIFTVPRPAPPCCRPCPPYNRRYWLCEQRQVAHCTPAHMRHTGAGCLPLAVPPAVFPHIVAPQGISAEVDTGGDEPAVMGALVGATARAESASQSAWVDHSFYMDDLGCISTVGCFLSELQASGCIL